MEGFLEGTSAAGQGAGGGSSWLEMEVVEERDEVEVVEGRDQARVGVSAKQRQCLDTEAVVQGNLSSR